MKKACSGPTCATRRAHWCNPDVERGVQMVEVPDGHEGKAYCSITCAVQDGAMTLRPNASQTQEARGGPVPATSDTVPVLLDPGVSYLSRSFVEKFGMEKLKAINGGGEIVVTDDGPAE
jgi:hypothetical protein